MATTLLKIVQDILSAMDSDEVNSIGDTVESRQVATVVETAYNNIITRTELVEHKEVFELIPSGDPALPNVMYKPNYVDSIEWIRYNGTIGTGYKDLNFVSFPYFFYNNSNLARSHNNDPALSSNEVNYNGNSIPLYYLNDRDPTEYTEVNGLGIVFNSVNLNREDTLEKTSTIAYGRRSFDFNLQDDFIPPLEPDHFNLLYQEAKSLAFAEIKQTSHAIAERNIKDSRINIQRRKDNSNQSEFRMKLPNYGRNTCLRILTRP